jgi:hypothetical protein
MIANGETVAFHLWTALLWRFLRVCSHSDCSLTPYDKIAGQKKADQFIPDAIKINFRLPPEMTIEFGEAMLEKTFEPFGFGVNNALLLRD